MDTINYSATWRPSAPVLNLSKRAKIIAKIRKFFFDRDILEVETPCLSQSTVTDFNLSPFKTSLDTFYHHHTSNLYLTTSPEFHMKRLLSAKYGPIFQICKSFRNEEIGRYHNPEFTILEWYRPGYSFKQLMHEVDDFLQQILGCNKVDMISYQEIFWSYLRIDPLSTNINKLRHIAKKQDLNFISDKENDIDILLQLLFSFVIAPNIGKNYPIFVYHFPANQALLSKISSEDCRVAERFEIFYKGIELGNGFNELTDPEEQQKRFEKENKKRTIYGLPKRPMDFNLIEALKHGMPDSAGIAIGIDRLVMLSVGAEKLSDIIAFPIERA